MFWPGLGDGVGWFCDDVIDAITTLAVRGSPALGVTGAFGVALAAYAHVGNTEKATSEALRIASARPTAVNLAWGVRRALARLSAGPDAVLAEAEQMLAEDADVNRVLRIAEVLVDETRPLLQGARLTAWELAEAGIPHRPSPRTSMRPSRPSRSWPSTPSRLPRSTPTIATATSMWPPCNPITVIPSGAPMRARAIEVPRRAPPC